MSTTMVAATTNVVNPKSGDDGCRLWQRVYMTTLLERLKWVLANRWHGNASKMSEGCGLKRTHVGTILRRLEENPNSDVEGETLAKIAGGSGINAHWLTTGEGGPSMDDPASSGGLLQGTSTVVGHLSALVPLNEDEQRHVAAALLMGVHRTTAMEVLASLMAKGARPTPVDLLNLLLAAEREKNGYRPDSPPVMPEFLPPLAEVKAKRERMLADEQAKRDEAEAKQDSQTKRKKPPRGDG